MPDSQPDPAASPPDPVATPRSAEGTQGAGKEHAPSERVVGRPFTSESAREALAERMRRRREAQGRSKVAVLTAALAGQADIAEGRVRDSTAAQRTAAARAIPDLQDALERAVEEEEQGQRIPWEQMSEARHLLLEAVLDMHEDDVVTTLESVGLAG